MDPKTFATEPYPVPRALETEEVQQYVEYFRTAARNAEAAGMDGVEVHCTNGYRARLPCCSWLVQHAPPLLLRLTHARSYQPVPRRRLQQAH